MSDPHGLNAGEVGGIIAAVLAVLGAIGGAIAWVVNWRERRAESRSAKLTAWQLELNERERALDERMEKWTSKLEERVKEQEGQIRALRLAFELVAAEQRAADPTNPALRRAEQLLSAAFPLELGVPGALGDALARID